MRETSLPRLVRALILTLVLGLGLTPQTASPAQAADATLVFAAYQAIMTHHIKQQDPVRLLAGALNGLRQALAKAGIAERLADLAGADETTAKTEFQARLDRAARLAQGKLTATQLQYAAAKAMAATLGDGWTYFETPEEAAPDIPGGIGVRGWYKFGRYVIFNVYPYSPAARAGLRPFDRILEIDGRSVKGMTRDDIGSRIGGFAPEGSTVKLTVRRPGQSAPLTFSIVGQRMPRPFGVTHRKLDGGLGYIWLRGLGVPHDSAEFRRALVDLQRDGMRGLVLDFRLSTTGGGYIQGLLVADTLLPAGVPIQTIVSHTKDVGTRRRPEVCPRLIQGHRWYLSDPLLPPLPSPCIMTTAGGTLLDPSTPLVVLVDETTNHIGLTMSTAIRDARRGRLLGVRPRGRTAVGPEVGLPGGAAIEVQRYIVLAGNGTVLDKVGVQPDVPVELTASDLDRGVDTQLERAVQILSR